jgi:phytoene synthase
VHSPAAADLLYLTALVRRLDRPRYYASLFARRSLRADLLALYGFAAEIEEAVARAREPTLAHIRLSWWRERLQEGERAGSSNESPALRATIATLHRHRLPVGPLLQLIDAAADLVDAEPPANLAAAQLVAERSEAPLFVLGAGLVGGGDGDVESAARNAGIAYGLARRRGALAIEPAALAESARHHARVARQHIEGSPPGLRPAFLPLAAVEPLLTRGAGSPLSDITLLAAIGRAALAGR